MDAMVSARVPIEIKKRGDGALKEIGSSATELINAAYRYVIEHGELPGMRPLNSNKQQQMKVLEGEAAKAFKEQWRSRSILEAPAYDGENFKDLLDDAREEYYARFA